MLVVVVVVVVVLLLVTCHKSPHDEMTITVRRQSLPKSLSYESIPSHFVIND